MHDYGFQFPWFVGCGGTEVPFTLHRTRYIYVWNAVERKHYYYCFDADVFIPDTALFN